MQKDDIFDAQKRSARLMHLVSDRGKEGTAEALEKILEKLDELDVRIAKLEQVKP